MVFFALDDFPYVQPGDDLARLVWEATQAQHFEPQRGDILVVAQKVVSKSENRYVDLEQVEPGHAACDMSLETGKDPRLVECILAESVGVVRARPGLIIAEHHTGQILANAGIDTSNIDRSGEGLKVLLWPEKPDESARKLSLAISALAGCNIPVVINDSIGRAWRLGTVGHAIGCYGIDPLWNQVGDKDLFGNELLSTEAATADGIAAAAVLIQGEAAEGRPIVWVRGCPFKQSDSRPATAMVRPHASDLFR